jgi:hypothetical protein
MDSVCHVAWGAMGQILPCMAEDIVRGTGQGLEPLMQGGEGLMQLCLDARACWSNRSGSTEVPSCQILPKVSGFSCNVLSL